MTFPEAQITPTEYAANCPRCGDGPFDARYPEDAGDLCGCPPQDDDYDGPLEPLDPQGDLHYAYAQRQERLDIAAALPYQQATPGSQNDWHYTFERYRKAGLSVSYAKRKADARLVPAPLWRQYRRDHDQQRDRIRKHRAWVALHNLNVCMGCGTFVGGCHCLPGKRMCRRCDPLPLTDYPRDCTCDCSPYLYDLRRAEWRVEIAERDLVAVATLAALWPILRAVRGDQAAAQHAVDLWVEMLNAKEY